MCKATLDRDIADLIGTLQVYQPISLLDESIMTATVEYAGGALTMEQAITQVKDEVALWLAEQN